ncbi:holo-[acyl-carrier protein] synthase [Phycisphaerales bacterium]|nr:holo-[acyl-carrier protein] synthase [Phycisphaerales bacterium]
MPILGHGIDLVEIRRVGEIFDRHGERFLMRVFTTLEQAHSLPARRRVEHLAGRFAAKEATLKALGTGLSHGIAWTDIEIRVLPSGQPTLRLHGQAESIARTLGVREWHLSISHSRDYAIASVIAMGAESEP